MKSLKTKYMGVEIDNPIVMGASNLATDLENLKKAEELGVGAIVFKSLFEEQIQLEKFLLNERLTEFNDRNAEMITTHPNIVYEGPEEFLVSVRNAREALSIPFFASLNAVNIETWIKYARLLSDAGVNGIELNFYQSPIDFSLTSKAIEDEQINVVKEIKKSITIPVSVKLSTGYTNILNFVKRLDDAGVDSVVLFNSFFQPDIDIAGEKHIKSFSLSNADDYRESMRIAGILSGNIKAEICSSHGIFTAADVIKLILSGSSCVQVVSTLYKNGLAQIGIIKKELSEWMDSKNYNSLDEFRGKLSQINAKRNDPFVYMRAQYVDLLMNSDNVFGVRS